MFQHDVFHAHGHAHTLYALCSTWVFTHNNDNAFRQKFADVPAQRPRNHMKAFTAMTNDPRSLLSLVCYHLSGCSLSFSTWLCFFSTRAHDFALYYHIYLYGYDFNFVQVQKSFWLYFPFQLQTSRFRYQISFPSQCDPTIMIQRNTVYASQDCISGPLQKHLSYELNY